MSASASRCALPTSRSTTASSACGYAVFPARATSSSSPPSCKTSRRWRCESSVHHPPGGAQHLSEVAYDYVSRVRVEVAANPAATTPNSRLNSVGSKRPKAQCQPKGLLFQQHRPKAALWHRKL